MRLEYHLVGGYVRYISPHNYYIIINKPGEENDLFVFPVHIYSSN